MCLQWCHVTEQIVNNDYPCFFCPPEIRLAQTSMACETCSHRRGERCQLTEQKLLRSQTCCHHNVVPQGGLMAVTDKNVHPALMHLHQVETVAQLFWAVETAPEPQVSTGNIVLLSIEELAVPWVYGLPAYAWPEEFPRTRQKRVHENPSRHLVLDEPIRVWR